MRTLDKLIKPLQVFTQHKLSGALLLMGAAVAALILANSPWRGFYESALALPVNVGAGDFVVNKPLLLWINDGLMGIFFFHVGLEIKREVLQGELATLRKATLPAVAALGGMLVPAALYFVLNAGGRGEGGWGIPMATDIAFALGVLALLGNRIPDGLRIFLTALAIVDDIGAVLVIAVFYTDNVSVVSLTIGAALYGCAIGFNLLQVRSSVAYFILGSLVWLAFLKSGVHATIAALLMAFTIPATTPRDANQLVDRVEGYIARLKELRGSSPKTLTTPQEQHTLDAMALQIDEASSPLLRLEHALVPVVSILVLPIFALANAGVSFGAGGWEALRDPIALGIIVGLFVGKQVGITAFAWAAVKLRIADLPQGIGWRGVFGVSVLAGIGFTMSLFIAGLAFGPALSELAKVGILFGSAISGITGWLILRTLPKRTDPKLDMLG